VQARLLLGRVLEHVIVRQDRAVAPGDHAGAAAARAQLAVDEVRDDHHHRRIERALDALGIRTRLEPCGLRHDRHAGHALRAQRWLDDVLDALELGRSAEQRDDIDLRAIRGRPFDRVIDTRLVALLVGVGVAIRGAQPVVAVDRTDLARVHAVELAPPGAAIELEPHHVVRPLRQLVDQHLDLRACVDRGRELDVIEAVLAVGNAGRHAAFGLAHQPRRRHHGRFRVEVRGRVIEREPVLGELHHRRRHERPVHAPRDDDDHEREQQHDAVVALVLQPQLAEIGLRAHAQARDRGGGDRDRIEVLERLLGCRHRRGFVDGCCLTGRTAGTFASRLAARSLARSRLGACAGMARATGLGLAGERRHDPIARQLHRRDRIARRAVAGRQLGHRGEVRLAGRGLGVVGPLRSASGLDRGTGSGRRGDHRAGLAVDVDHLADDDRGVHRGLGGRRQHRRIRDERRGGVGLRRVRFLVVLVGHAPSFLNGERSSRR